MITTVTRKIWRNTFNGTTTGPYFDMVHFDAKGQTFSRLRNANDYVIYDCEYVAQAASFQQIEAHTELGGYALALRENVVYAIFTEQDGPGFAELWQGVTYHLIVSITEEQHGQDGQSDRP